MSSARLGQVWPRPHFRRLVGVNHEWEICGREGERAEPPAGLTQTERAAVTLGPPVLRRGRAAGSEAPVRAGIRDTGASRRRRGAPPRSVRASPRLGGDAEHMRTV